MIKVSANVKMFLDLAKIQAVMNRRYDSSLGGLGFNEFIIMYQLSQAEGESMRRVDLAEKIGLTASGVTRILLPMEKIGLVKSGSSENDARVRNVSLAAGGKTLLTDALDRAELLSDEIIDSANIKKQDGLAESISKLAASI